MIYQSQTSSSRSLAHNRVLYVGSVCTPGVSYFDPVMELPSRPAKQLKTYIGDQLMVNHNMNYRSDCNNLSSSHSGNLNCYAFSNDFEGGSGGANVTSANNHTRCTKLYLNLLKLVMAFKKFVHYINLESSLLNRNCNLILSCKWSPTCGSGNR